MKSPANHWVCATLLLGVAPVLTLGQETPSDDGTLEEIVVTAQKREESLRDVPLSVEAVTGDKLADAGIVRLDDLKAYVPNLQITETGIANNIYIRGIGSGLNQGFEQSVSTYMDGVYRGRGHQSRMPFLDLARVEVLRGPQPILFGKNAVAGAINLVAAQPTKTFQGSARASYDFENEDLVSNLVLSGPFSDRFGGRVALYHRDANGYLNNATLNREEPQRKETAGRVILAGDFTDTLRASLRIEGGKYDTTGRQIEIFNETPISVGPLAPLNLTYSQIVGGTAPAFITQGRDPSALDNTVNYQRSSSGDSSKVRNFETALTVNYDLPADVTLTAISGYSHYKMDELCDCDFTGATIFNAGINEQYDQYSQEIRLASPASGTFSWIGGLFWQDYKLTESDYLYVPPTSLVMPVLTRFFLGEFLAGRASPCNSLATCTGAAGLFANRANPRDFSQHSKLYSAFLQGTWKVTDAFSITAGGRLSRENKTGRRTTLLTSGIGGAVTTSPAVIGLFNAVLGILPHSESGSRGETNFSPLVNFQYRYAPESMAYLSLSRGYKSGGYDARSNRPVAAGGSFEFEDERASTAELGVKSGIGGTAEINANVFYTDYKDLQTSAFDGAIGFNVGNGTAKVKGAELEGRWRATPQFLLSGSLAFLDFSWKKYNGQCYFDLLLAAPTVSNCNYAGRTNQLAPKFTGYVSAEYTWPIGANLKLTTTADLVHSSKYLQSLNLDPVATQSAYSKLNARIAFGSSEDRWELALIGRNLTDKTTISYAGDTPLAFRLFRARSYYGFVDQPRGIALEARVKF
jgi:outer membrane receptor protein involved in Fe transport